MLKSPDADDNVMQLARTVRPFYGPGVFIACVYTPIRGGKKRSHCFQGYGGCLGVIIFVVRAVMMPDKKQRPVLCNP